jgi:hypothetical protein
MDLKIYTCRIERACGETKETKGSVCDPKRANASSCVEKV